MGILSATIASRSFGAGSWMWWLGVFAAVPLMGYVPWILWLSRFRAEANFRSRQQRILEQLDQVDAEIDTGYVRLRAIEQELGAGDRGGLSNERAQEERLLREKERDVIDLGRDLAEVRLRWLDEQAAAFEVLAAGDTLEKAPALPEAILLALEAQLARAKQWYDEHEGPDEPEAPWLAAIDRLTTLRAAFTRGRERLRSVRQTRDRRAARSGSGPELDSIAPHTLGAQTMMEAVEAQLDALVDLDALDSDGSGVYVRVDVEGGEDADEEDREEAVGEATNRPSIVP